MLAPCLHAVPSEHAHPLLSPGFTDAGQGLDLPALPRPSTPGVFVLCWGRCLFYQHPLGVSSGGGGDSQRKEEQGSHHRRPHLEISGVLAESSSPLDSLAHSRLLAINSVVSQSAPGGAVSCAHPCVSRDARGAGRGGRLCPGTVIRDDRLTPPQRRPTPQVSPLTCSSSAPGRSCSAPSCLLGRALY